MAEKVVDLAGSQVYRLSDIVTEEVSAVDRPANKRAFLVVKRDGGELMSKQADPSTPATPPAEPSVSDPKVDEKKADGLKVDDVPDPAGQPDPTPTEPSGDAAAKAVTQQAHVAVVQLMNHNVVMALHDAAGMLHSLANVVESGGMDEDQKNGMIQSVLDMLGRMPALGSHGDTMKSGHLVDERDLVLVDSVLAVAELHCSQPDQPASKTLVDVARRTDRLLKAIEQKGQSDEVAKRIVGAVERALNGLVEKYKTAPAAVPPPAPTPLATPPVDEGSVAKQLDGQATRIKELEAELAKRDATPPSRASRGTVGTVVSEGPAGGMPDRLLFPLNYNDPVTKEARAPFFVGKGE